MPPPSQLEIAGSAGRLRDSHRATSPNAASRHNRLLSTAHNAAAAAAADIADRKRADPPTPSNGSSSFRPPRIQRDRKPEYKQVEQDDDEEEEGAITAETDKASPPPRQKHAQDPPQQQHHQQQQQQTRRDSSGSNHAAPGSSRLDPPPPPATSRREADRHEPVRRPRTPPRAAEPRRPADPPSSSRAGDGGFFTAARPLDRDRYRSSEDRARDAWDRGASPPAYPSRHSIGHRSDAYDNRYGDAWYGQRDRLPDVDRDRDRDRAFAYASRTSGDSYRPASPPPPSRRGYYPQSPSPPRAAVAPRARPYAHDPRSAWDDDLRDERGARPSSFGDADRYRDRPPRAPSPPRDRDRRFGRDSRNGEWHASRPLDPPAHRRTRAEYDDLHDTPVKDGPALSAARPGDLDTSRPATSRKRSRSPSRSPPAGLLKRKPNFTAVQAPEPVDASTALAKSTLGSQVSSALAGTSSYTPGLESSLDANGALSGVSAPRSGKDALLASDSNDSWSAQPGAPEHQAVEKKSLPGPDDSRVSKVASACEALDDPSCPSVKLSCAPRNRGALSGPQRRKSRPPPVPLNERKFYGCSSLDDYEITVKLGQGTFGEVKKGRHITTGVQVALKKVTIHDEQDGMPITALREVKLLKKLSHPSIVPVIDMAYRPSRERGKLGDVYMVEPYMDHDLNGMLDNPNIRLEHSQIKLYMKQLLEGTLYLHKNRVLHRDMKAANLLISNEGQLQIADFGLARPYRDPGQGWKAKGWQGGLHKYTNMVVTRWYRPPELLAGEKKYGPPIDMWGIGCILAEMVTGKPIFKGTSEINQLELISKLCGSPNEDNFPGWSSLPGVKNADPNGRPDPNPQVPGKLDFGNYERSVKTFFRTTVDVGPECADLIDKLLVLDPARRLTAAEALDHDYFWSKPFPADPSSLPKYDPSKELDRTKRDFKLPIQARPPPAPPPQQTQPYGMARQAPGSHPYPQQGPGMSMSGGMGMGQGPGPGMGMGMGMGVGMAMGMGGGTGRPPPMGGYGGPPPPPSAPGYADPMGGQPAGGGGGYGAFPNPSQWNGPGGQRGRGAPLPSRPPLPSYRGGGPPPPHSQGQYGVGMGMGRGPLLPPSQQQPPMGGYPPSGGMRQPYQNGSGGPPANPYS